MENSGSAVPFLAFRRLLFDLLDNKSSACVRFRLLGEMWKTNFMRPLQITVKGAIFMDETIQEFVHVFDLTDVVQFEIDARFQEFQPHFHYDLGPDA